MMVGDVMRDNNGVFLGSRLKRLGERMQAGAARVIADAGLPLQPVHMPLVAALEGRSLTVGQLVEAVGISQPGVTRAIGQLVGLGLVRSDTGADQRRRTISLTPAGDAAMARTRLRIWPQVEDAVGMLCGGDVGAFLDRLTAMENMLAATPLDTLAARATPPPFVIHDYAPDLAAHFHDINAEWIGAMFRMEDTDREVLGSPQARIIDGGGDILFVEARGLGIVGTCALQKTGPNAFELTKMGVRATARGLKVGEFLLAAVIERAKSLHADPLYLLTSKKCAAAIHLYEKLGFRHDAEVMARYGARYARCDVAMRYFGDTPPAGQAAGMA